MHFNLIVFEILIMHQLLQEAGFFCSIHIIEFQQLQVVLHPPRMFAHHGIHINAGHKNLSQAGAFYLLLRLLSALYRLTTFLRNPLAQRLMQFIFIQRLRDKILKTAVQEHLSRIIVSIGRKRNHNRLFAIFATIIANVISRLNTIHLRHHMIH